MADAVQLVWFKRDLRVHDHAALDAAAARGPVLPLYVVEPELWRQPDASGRQWQFVHASLQDLNRALAALGQPLLVRQGDACDVLAALRDTCVIAAVHAHQETGNGWTYARDERVRAYLRDAGVPLFEYRQNGVVRGLRSRDGWARQWETLVGATRCGAPRAIKGVAGLDAGIIPDWPAPELAREPGDVLIQPGGRKMAQAVLDGFLGRRVEGYSGGISRPESAWLASSRLSPHLAHGTLSLREVVQAARERRAVVKGDAPSAQRAQWLRSLKRFEERLHWHCHFMQKLESEPRFEYQNMQRACDGLREGEFNDALFAAWSRGETGFPLVDACMRQLHARGWLNFRMRAMVVSFASYNLWLDWRRTGPFLARQFTDYEAGIHYCQMQMQSGTTGINTLRIYNPVKQSEEQDGAGAFIRRWVPELDHVPTGWLHQPWAMPMSVQRQADCVLDRDYPHRIVDHQEAARRARERFRAVRHDPDANREADAIQHRHGSRRGARTAKKRPSSPRNDPQGELF
ncbi:deoxyribodipyrimidine photo-lyase [Aquisalimonas sp.]|uniref:FAD-binding domain-containing protein n=1 Tax=unclassified Aquisalimonas TaxID=2644645 RepID=UPI0025BC93FE|nr:deoxyribodipyrimidine photo-lyase [Aquisalimonas sp.]